MLKARKLEVVLGGNQIVSGVDMEVRAGQLIGILGPSGSGKSTLLRAMSGFRPATKGVVTFEGSDLYEEFESLKRRIGFVPQEPIPIHIDYPFCHQPRRASLDDLIDHRK